MTNTILEQSYAENAKKADTLKSSYSFTSNKNTSSSNFMSILSGMTSNSNVASDTKTQADLSKKSSQSSSYLFQSPKNTVKAVQNQNSQTQQDTSQVKTTTKKTVSASSSKQSTVSGSTQANTKEADDKTQTQNQSQVVQSDKTDLSKKSSVTSSDDAGSKDVNDDSVSTDDTAAEDNQTNQVSAENLVENFAPSVDEDITTILADDEEVVPDDSTLEAATTVDSDDKIDLNTLNTLNTFNSLKGVNTTDDDSEKDVSANQLNEDDSTADDVKIKVSTETVDINKTQDKDSKATLKQSSEISDKILNELDATVVGLKKDADTSSSTDDFSSGQNALEQAVMLSIEGTSDSSDSQDFSKLLNVDMLKQVDAKSSVDVLNSVQSAKPATNVDIINQISEKIAEMRNGTADKIEIALKPANLGKVNVEISSTKGVVTATLIAENEQVRGALDKNIDSLKSTLASQGVNVNSISVKVNDAEKSAMNNNFDFSKEQFMNNSQNQGKNERAQETYTSTKTDTGNLDENSKDEGDTVLTSVNTNEGSYYKGLVDYKI